ncbi:MAG: hypothetical protein MZW92_12195 [Comamonadaceae bacterium]|nr:hypothetical protein [Comamonadaceae bacterium]
MDVPTLPIRRVGIDTWRENVAYLHRDCPVVRADGFQALAKVEVQANGAHASLAVLNVVDDARIVEPRELGLSEEAFARAAAWPRATRPRVAHAEPPASIAALHRKIAGERLARDDLRAIVRDIAARALFEDRAGGLRGRHQPVRARPRRGAAPDRGDDRRRPAPRLAARGRRRPGGRQALHRRHPGQPHLDAGGADRRRARHADARRPRRARSPRRPAPPTPWTCWPRSSCRSSGWRRSCASTHGCLAWGGTRRPVAGRRHADLGRAAAGDRLAGADGGLDPVARRSPPAPPTWCSTFPLGPTRQGAHACPRRSG